MDNHTILAEISNYLLTLLKENCVPLPVGNPDKIGFVSQGGSADFALSLFLYDIELMSRGNFSDIIFPLRLKYFITADSQSLSEIRAEEETRILAKAVWTFANYPVIDKNLLDNNDTPAAIQMENLSMDEKVKILDFANISKTAVFYSVSPVLLNLEKGSAAVRVRSVK